VDGQVIQYLPYRARLRFPVLIGVCSVLPVHGEPLLDGGEAKFHVGLPLCSLPSFERSKKIVQLLLNQLHTRGRLRERSDSAK